ncbi:MAG: hypothetical protein JWO91_3488 [Acidobacteriaceae bacterium]|nr:hypothetical protein [Acidobacteriaceae bacterium]
MASVTIWKHLEIDNRWKCCRAVIGANNKIKPKLVHVNSRTEEHAGGTYYLHWQNGKQIWKKSGTHPAQAMGEAERQQALLNALLFDIPAQTTLGDPSGETIYASIKAYLEAMQSGIAAGTVRWNWQQERCKTGGFANET